MDEHVLIGMCQGYGQEVPLTLSRNDRRHHLYTVGKSGTGKTALQYNLILQDILAGRGVAVFDPHGDLSSKLLDSIPSHHAERVTYFAPADAEFSIGFNILGRVTEGRKHLVASGVVGAFRSVWPDSWGPRMEYILYAALAAVLDCQNVSLLSVQRMLSDTRYRSWIVKQVKDPMVRAFWKDEFENYSDALIREAVAPIQNKVGQLLMSPQLRNILGQVRSRFDARFIMDESRIFIADLSKGKLGADKSNLIGSLLVTEFQLAAMSRADTEEHLRKDFYLYVDEFQSFTSDAFTTILSEARKYRLCLTLSHQYLAQLRPNILDAVIGNVGSIVVFRVGHDDAERLQMALGESYSARTLSTLSNGAICAKVLVGGEDTEAQLGRTFPPQGESYGRSHTIIRRSRERYGTQRAKVEEKIKRWLGDYSV